LNIALLFDNQRIPATGSYVEPPKKAIFSSQVLQSNRRRVRASHGDLLLGMYGYSTGTGGSDLAKLAKIALTGRRLQLINQEIPVQVLLGGGVYTWLLENSTHSMAVQLDAALRPNSWYLGLIDVQLSHPLHLQIFRRNLSEVYAFWGDTAYVLYSEFDTDPPDPFLLEQLESFGFTAGVQSTGARRTVFDKYLDVAHFKRIEEVQSYLPMLPCLSEDVIDELVFDLEEIHPRLFDVLAAVVRVAVRAETEEEAAQVALSGRRFFEFLADCLYPPRQTATGERKLGQPQYKNRLWAYITEAFAPDTAAGRAAGEELDRLISRVNAGLHDNVDPSSMRTIIADQVSWVANLIAANPEHSRRPLLAYADEISRMLSEFLSKGDLGE
jgi:hypothetical protein